MVFTEPLGLVGQPLRYRGVGRGEAFDEADTVTQTLRGTDLKPYAPAHVTGVWDASGITLSWRRRTRIGGDWRDGTGTVPLAEAAEAYEADILDGAGAVIRVLETATPQVLYPAADAEPSQGRRARWARHRAAGHDGAHRCRSKTDVGGCRAAPS